MGDRCVEHVWLDAVAELSVQLVAAGRDLDTADGILLVHVLRHAKGGMRAAGPLQRVSIRHH